MTHVLTIPGRPRSTKNSRQVVRRGGKTRTIMSDAAAEWIHGARIEVRRQWRGRPLQHPVYVHVHVVFANRRSLPDGDNMVNAAFDALKGIVTVDDNLACIPSHLFTFEVTPGAAECLRLTISPAR